MHGKSPTALAAALEQHHITITSPFALEVALCELKGAKQVFRKKATTKDASQQLRQLLLPTDGSLPTVAYRVPRGPKRGTSYNTRLAQTYFLLRCAFSLFDGLGSY